MACSTVISKKQENRIGTVKVEHDLTDNLTLSNTAVYSKSKNDYLWTQPDDSKGNIATGRSMAPCKLTYY